MKKKNNFLTVAVYVFIAALVVVAIGAVISSIVSKNKDSSVSVTPSDSSVQAPGTDGSDQQSESGDVVNTDNNDEGKKSDAKDSDGKGKNKKGSGSEADNTQNSSNGSSDDGADDGDKPLTEHEVTGEDGVIEIPFDVFQEE